MLNRYIYSGSLPENASTYVTREADSELYESLKAGNFCYVLNSRQSGKSSIRVRTMRRLRDAGIECAAIDLSAGGVQNVTLEQWYVDLIDYLIESLALDIDLAQWWSENKLHSEVTRFRKFIEEILLTKVKSKIVIFIDEIDSVLSLNFPTDDFFALIRACYNQRVDNLEYNRLTFCLLGVASPNNLIKEKQRTPFNIGQAINLKGFQLHEVEPLRKGLEKKFPNSQEIIQEILYWTGGQPFLTQKLCQFMVEESEKGSSRSVQQVVRARIVENWELNDEPEHLRTIRSRIFREEQHAGYLLDLYQQICFHGKVLKNDSAEQSELLLSGLVVKHEDKLIIYNKIYQEVFNQNWIDAELKKLRPYSENFRAWVASEYIDESRLLRGNALKDAEKWSKDKNLSFQDKQFLAASKEKEIQEEIAAKEKEAQLERERKDREATEERNKVLTEAYQKAQKQIKRGSFIFISTLLMTGVITGILAIQAFSTGKQVSENSEYLITVEKLTKLAGKIQKEGSNQESEKIFSEAGAAVNIKEVDIRQQVLYAAIAYSYLQLQNQNFQKSQEYLDKIVISGNPTVDLQMSILKYNIEGIYYKKNNDINKAIDAYKKAFLTVEKLKNKYGKISPPFNSNIVPKILSARKIENLHQEYKDLLCLASCDKNIIIAQLGQSLKEHHYDELNYLLKNKNWQEADQKTTQILLYITENRIFNEESIKNLSCQELKRIDDYWTINSDGMFGFSVQKQIYLNTGNQLNSQQKPDNNAYLRFMSKIGWYNQGHPENGWVTNQDYNKLLSTNNKQSHLMIGSLPFDYLLRDSIPRSEVYYFSKTNLCRL